MKEIKLSPLLNQNVLSKLANYTSERGSIDKYYLVEVIYTLLGDVDEDELRKNYKDYDIVKKKLEKLNQKIQISKTFYDAIQDKAFKTKYKDLDKFQKFLKDQYVKVSSKIPLIEPDVYRLFVYLVKNCSVQNYTMRPEMLKVLEYRDNTRIDLSKKKKEQPTGLI